MKTVKAGFNQMKNEASHEGESLFKEISEKKSMTPEMEKKEDSGELREKVSRSDRKYC